MRNNLLRRIGFPGVRRAFFAVFLAFSGVVIAVADVDSNPYLPASSGDEIENEREAVFFAVNPVDSNDVYIQWDMPLSAASGYPYDFAGAQWFLGAYRHVPENGNGGSGLYIVLNREILDVNMICALHYIDDGDQPLYVDLLDANGAVLAADLYGNLMTGSGADMTFILELPLARSPDAAVIRLRCDGGDAAVLDSRIYAERGRGIGGSGGCDYAAEHAVDAGESGLIAGDCPACAAQTAASGDDNLERSAQVKQSTDTTAGSFSSSAIIRYVDQMLGDDEFTGCSQEVCGRDGPKRTIRGGISAADGVDMLIIKAGVYGEDLDIKDRDIKVVIEGDVIL